MIRWETYDVVALSDGEKKGFCYVGLDGNEVGGHDRHLVAIEGDSDVLIDGHVDEAETILLSLRDRDLVVRSASIGILVRTIDQDVVGCWRSSESL
jgi:hypothetical protein